MSADRPCSASRRSGIRSPSARTTLSIAAVAPEPQNSTTSWSEPPTASCTIRRASSRRRIVWRPVADDSVCVFAYSGSTSLRMKSSMKLSDRPDAV